MNLLDQLGDFVGDVVGSVGDNLEAGGTSQKAYADRLAINNAIAVQQARDEQARKERLLKIVEIAAIGSFSMLALVVISFMGLKIYKSLK